MQVLWGHEHVFVVLVGVVEPVDVAPITQSLFGNADDGR